MGGDPVELTVETRARTEFVPLARRIQAEAAGILQGDGTRTVRLAFLSA